MCVNIAALYNYQGMASSNILFFFTHISNTGSLTEKKKKPIGSENSGFVGHLMNWHM